MMSVEEYALDVNKTVEEIMALCDKLDIKYDDKDSMLEDVDIVTLDNEVQNDEEEV